MDYEKKIFFIKSWAIELNNYIFITEKGFKLKYLQE